MKKPILALSISALVLGAGIAVTAFLGDSGSKPSVVYGDELTYTLSITDMSDLDDRTVQTTNGNDISFYAEHFSSGVLSAETFLQTETALHGIKSVSVNADKDIKIFGGFYQSGTSSVGWDLDNPYAEGNGNVVADFSVARPNYFAIVAGEEDVTISSINVTYTCDEASHHVKIHLYETTDPEDYYGVYYIGDTNWTINDGWIDKGDDWHAMTFIAKEGEYYHYTYEADFPFGLQRFQFAAAKDGINYKLSYSADWKPYSYYLNDDVELYCYADSGFPASSDATNLFTVKDSDIVEHAVVVGWWSYSTSGLTSEIANAFKTGAETALMSNNVTITLREYSQSKVADLGSKINGDGDVDVFLGAGQNLKTEGKVDYTARQSDVTMGNKGGRYVYQLTSGMYSKLVYDYAISAAGRGTFVTGK